ncbi:hypothetical protein GR268_40125, partial [Rhizobium leguminosarum]|nr:hypothetical protein [Rhizobium leguminosarum]
MTVLDPTTKNTSGAYAAFRPLLQGILPSATAFLLALAAGAILIVLWGGNPVTAYAALADGAFGSWNSIAEPLLRAIPLTFTGLAVAIA